MNEPNPKARKAKKKPERETRAKEFSIQPYNFETRSGRFWFLNQTKDWLELPPKEFARYLSVSFGFSLKRVDGVPSICERIITQIQNTRVVNAVASLAGHFGPKIIHHGGLTILVKDAPRLIEPKEGEYPIITLLLSGMLTPEQYSHLIYWLHQAVDDLYHHRLTLATAQVLCGPHSAGKSLWQRLQGLVLGGRSARPYQFMSGQTTFNSHIVGSEYLIIEDEHSATDLKSRLALGNAIKAFVANAEKQVHAKYQTPFIPPPVFQRLSVSLNDESENVALLPPGDASLDHKVNYYDVSRSPMPMPTNTSAEQEIFWQTLVAELPAFIWDLLYNTHIPLEWMDGRFGLKAFRAQRVLDLLEEHQPEVKLLELLDCVYFEQNCEFIAISGSYPTLTLTEMEAHLRHKDSPVKSLSDDLLRGPSQMGKYMQRLVKKRPDRVVYKRTASARLYSLLPPNLATP